MRTARVAVASVIVSIPMLLSACAPARPTPVLGPMERWADGRIEASRRADAAVLAKLDEPAGEIRVESAKFEDVLNMLADRAGVSVVPSWGSMEQLGILPTTELSLHLKDVTLEVALRELFAKVCGREDVLDYMIRDGVVKVSTADDLATLKYLAIYDVRDLLWSEPDPPKVAALRRGPAEESEEEREGGLFGGASSPSCSYRERTAIFLDLLRTTVFPDTWAPCGDANVIEYQGLLIVKQTARGHRELALLLQSLRAGLAEVEGRAKARP